MQQPPVPMQNFKLQVNPHTLPNFHCPDCHGKVFTVPLLLKHVTALQAPIPLGKRGVIPVNDPTQFLCLTCNRIVCTDDLMEEKDVKAIIDSREGQADKAGGN